MFESGGNLVRTREASTSRKQNYILILVNNKSPFNHINRFEIFQALFPILNP